MKPLPTFFLLLGTAGALLANGNRLTHLEDSTPFWPSSKTAKFITPQWVGEKGVDTVVILGIDDMRDAAKYETFLRPIIDRLRRIEPRSGGDGRAGLSIMTNTVAPDAPQFQTWLAEGLSLEIHTLTHPCPCLGKVTFEEAQRTYHGGVDLLAGIPNNRPTTFRMPCCDSINSTSPRFFAEIFNRGSEQGRWLAADSSVFTLPPGERFARYLPHTLRPPQKLAFERYAGFIDDYPYPFVVGNQCWEFPMTVPSDWEAFNILGKAPPELLEDWKAALDHTVRAQGMLAVCFHPHGWSSAEQLVSLIDYAEATYGKRVKFLSFRDAVERLEKHAIGAAAMVQPTDGGRAGEALKNVSHSLRSADGGDHGVRLLDVNADGFMDVVFAGPGGLVTRIWDSTNLNWNQCATPVAVGTPVIFGVLDASGAATMLQLGAQPTAWTFHGGGWQQDPARSRRLPAGKKSAILRDFDGDGVCEFLADRIIFVLKTDGWQVADFTLPDGCALTDAKGGDNGLRFVDLNGDGFDDVFQSNDKGYAIHLWAGLVKANLGWKRGWPHLVASGPAATDVTTAKVLPFVKNGRNYGGWFHRGHAVWQNEDTFPLEAYVLRRSFKELVAFEVPPPKSAQAALEAMRPRPGFRVELVAAEPLVESPVAFDWDAAGRLWVVEMRDYPLGIDGKGKPGGVVKFLTDSDSDGRYDKATTFLEGLAYPTGIFPWRNGVLIAASADILFAADTDGDGHADERRVLFTGFKEGNQQHRQNGYEWGLDGWIYGANGDSGGTINGVSISGRDFRFRPDTGEFEAESGQTQFGRRRDDFGHWFGNNNSTWLWHYTLEDRYLRRNPRLAVKTTKQMLANYPEASRVFPQSSLPIRFNQPQSLGHLTSGCSPTPYRDALFGEAFATSVFIAEPVHNVVHREVLTPDGATFTSRRAADELDREFIASTDPWFRPVMLKTGPDGALYIADFYRFVLEHPEWIAPETQSRLDLRAGADKGRIYRVLPTGAKLRPIPNLAAQNNAQLAAALDHPNGWQRDTVQRLLMERAAKDTTEAISGLATQAANPKVRVQALATLGTLQTLNLATIRTALRDEHPAVRRQALRSSESLSTTTKELLPALFAISQDSDFTVRHQLALSLGAFPDPRTSAVLEQLAAHDGSDPHMRLAILSSLQPGDPLFTKLNLAPPKAAATNFVPPKPSTADRAKVIGSYKAVNALAGNAERGRELYRQQCAVCHRYKGDGQEVGPDLAMVANKPVDWLITAIFDPNAAIEDRFQSHTITLKNGTELSGLISAETANNVVLRLPGGVDLPVLRADIRRQKRSGRSLMPEGLEKTLQPQAVADLLAFIRAQ
jgi:putative membrane-bound dehydrogenase-like protein